MFKDESGGAVRRPGARSTDCRAKRAGADRSGAESGDEAAESGDEGRESGQVMPLIAVAIVLVGGIALVIGHIGGMLVAHAQARAAADAAALAGALDGPAAAAEAAAANGARLLDVTVDDTDTEVKVQVGDAIACLGPAAVSAVLRRPPRSRRLEADECAVTPRQIRISPRPTQSDAAHLVHCTACRVTALRAPLPRRRNHRLVARAV